MFFFLFPCRNAVYALWQAIVREVTCKSPLFLSFPYVILSSDSTCAWSYYTHTTTCIIGWYFLSCCLNTGIYIADTTVNAIVSSISFSLPTASVPLLSSLVILLFCYLVPLLAFILFIIIIVFNLPLPLLLIVFVDIWLSC